MLARAASQTIWVYQWCMYSASLVKKTIRCGTTETVNPEHETHRRESWQAKRNARAQSEQARPTVDDSQVLEWSCVADWRNDSPLGLTDMEKNASHRASTGGTVRDRGPTRGPCDAGPNRPYSSPRVCHRPWRGHKTRSPSLVAPSLPVPPKREFIVLLSVHPMPSPRSFGAFLRGRKRRKGDGCG